MPVKPAATCMDAVLPLGGTRDAAAHVADACVAVERTANGVALVENAAPMSKMDSMNGADTPPPSFLSRQLSPLKSGCCSVRRKA